MSRSARLSPRAVVDVYFQPFPMGSAARGQVWRYAPQFRSPRHFHAEPELNLVAAGTATFGVGEGQVDVGPGDLLWWLPGQDHELTQASTDLDLFVIGLTPALSERVLGSLSRAAECGPVVTGLGAATARDLLARCLALGQATDTAAIEQRVGDLWRDAHELRGPHVEMHALTRRALGSLRRSTATRRAAIAGGADPGDVSRHFRRDVRLSLSAYRNRLRLMRFIEEVDRNRRGLLSAALAAGFGSYSQCHRSFRRVFCSTPRDFFSWPDRVAMSRAYAPFPEGSGR